MALSEINKEGRLYQKVGAWREKGDHGYHVSDMYRPLYEKQLFLFFKGFSTYLHTQILTGFIKIYLWLRSLPPRRTKARNLPSPQWT